MVAPLPSLFALPLAEQGTEWGQQQQGMLLLLGLQGCILFVGLYAVAYSVLAPWLLAHKYSSCRAPIAGTEAQPTFASKAKEHLSIAVRIVGPFHAVPVGVAMVFCIAAYIQSFVAFLALNEAAQDESGFDQMVAAAAELAPMMAATSSPAHNLPLLAMDLSWENFVIRAACTFSLAYIAVDTIVNILIGNFVMVVHHLITGVAQAVYLFNPLGHTLSYDLFTAVLLATELTVPPLHLSYLLQKFGIDGVTAFVLDIPRSLLNMLLAASSVGVLVYWVIFRFLTFGMLVYFEVHQCPHRWCGRVIRPAAPEAVTSGEYFGMGLACTMIAVLTVLNITWFRKLVAVAINLRRAIREKRERDRNRKPLAWLEKLLAMTKSKTTTKKKTKKKQDSNNKKKNTTTTTTTTTTSKKAQ